MIKNIAKALIGALFGALIFSSSPAIADWMPLIEDIEGHLLVEPNATHEYAVTDYGPIAVQGSFRRLETNDQYKATVLLPDCVKESGRITIGKNQTEDWSAKTDRTFDLVAKYLCDWADQHPTAMGAD